jgi:hypothetical protein
MRLEPLRADYASKLLRQHVPQASWDKETADVLVKHVRGQPLAVAMIGGYVRKVNCTLADFLVLLRGSAAVLWSGRDDDPRSCVSWRSSLPRLSADIFGVILQYLPKTLVQS